MKPSKLTQEQFVHIFKVAAYAGASAFFAALISFVTNQPDLFGPLTPLINILLVTARKVFEE